MLLVLSRGPFFFLMKLIATISRFGQIKYVFKIVISITQVNERKQKQSGIASQ